MTRSARLLVALLSLLVAACQTEVYRGLSQRDANEMVAALASAGIEGRRTLDAAAGTYAITVAEEDLAAAVTVLKQLGLPRQQFRSLEEIFPGDGLIVTPYEQRIRTMFALNQELARTITSIDGVIDARVHVVLPDLDLRGLPMNQPSASIILHHAPAFDTVAVAAQVRLLVANSVQGMDFRNVSVAFFPMEGVRRAAQPVQAGGGAMTGPAERGGGGMLSMVVSALAILLLLAGAVLFLRDRFGLQLPGVGKALGRPR